MDDASTVAATSSAPKRLMMEILAGLLPPLVTLAIQYALRDLINPYIWFLFYPPVIFSSWLGGWRSGVLATVLSTALIWWFFVSHEHSLSKDPLRLFPTSVFFTTNVIIALFIHRLQTTSVRLRRALQERMVFEALIENSSDFIGIADPDGKPTYVNPAGRRMVGLAPDFPVQNTQIPEYYPPELRRFVNDVIVKAMLELGSWSGETCFRNWQTDASIPVSDEHFMIREPCTGRILGMGTVTRDISELKRARDEIEFANQELQRANELVSSLFEQAPDGIFTSDLDGRYIAVNSAACSMLGYSRQELLGMRITDLIPGEDLQRLASDKEQMLQGAVEVGEWSIRRKNGTRLPVEVSATILPDGRWQAFVRDISKRKRAEEALRVSEAKFSRILAISADAIISIDEEHHITMFNEGAEKIFGYTKAEAVGASIEMLIPKRFRPRHAEQVRQFAAGLQAARTMGERGRPIFGLRKNGEEFPADASISKLEIGGRSILTVALRDITEQIQAQEQIRQSQERYDLALRGANLGAWDWNVQTGEVIFNAQWAEMRGYRIDEIRTHVDAWTEGVHPDDMAHVQKALSDHFQGLIPEYEAEHRVRTKSGNWIWILDRGKIFMRDEKGQPLRMVGTELDITERKRIESELSFLAEAGPVVAASLDFEETLASVAQLAVRDFADFCVVDIVEEDGTVRRLKVTSRDPLKNWICDGLMKIAIDQKRHYLTRTAPESQRPVLMERVLSDDLAAFAHSEEHLRLLRAAEIQSAITVPLMVRGKLLGGIVLVSSRPFRIYRPPDLRLAEELARRAALSIENARLYRSARRAIQVRDDVLGIVAHDLRNPLGNIIMQTALLQRRGSEPERRRRTPVEAIGRAATRMNRLIQDLLDVSHIEAGGLTIEPTSVPVAQVLADALDAHRSLAASGNLELRLDVAPELPAVWADRSRLLQILENLIGNAMKFTPPGGQITLRAGLCMSEVEFQVADTGKGISTESLPHIFDRFWQAQKSGQGGTGLGLSIVKGLVEAHKGHLWAESTPGHGSTFYFTLPTAPAVEWAR